MDIDSMRSPESTGRERHGAHVQERLASFHRRVRVLGPHRCRAGPRTPCSVRIRLPPPDPRGSGPGNSGAWQGCSSAWAEREAKVEQSSPARWDPARPPSHGGSAKMSNHISMGRRRVRSLHINCRKEPTTPRVLQRIVQHLDPRHPDRGLGGAEILASIRRMLRTEHAPDRGAR